MRVATSSRLLTQLTSFVGRADELVELGRLLRSERLLTLTGPAGVGKTRLAIELAKQEQGSRRREVVFVELDSLAEGDTVRRRVATLLGDFDGDHDTDTEPSLAALPDRNVLLVLDTCDHVLEECSQLLSELLPKYSNTRVLVTSREPMRLPGETVHSLIGLPLPDGYVESPPSEYLRWASVRLFWERARSVDPRFQITEENAEHVGAICATLDGLPLAIELAAQLVRTFSPAEISTQLDRPTSLLTGGWRTSDRRHQSLRASFQWSYELLTSAEQRLFRRISVLPGGFGSHLAAAVNADKSISVSEATSLLARLSSKSLVTRSADQFGLARFRMLESIRSYGHERLRAAGEEREAHDSSVGWLADLSSTLHATSIVSAELVQRLKEEQGNLEYALDRLSTSNDERQLLLAGALGTGVAQGGRDDASSAVSELVVGALDRVDPLSGYRAIALEGAALLASRAGKYDDAVRYAQEAVDSERRNRCYSLLSRLLLLLSSSREMRGESVAALADLHASLSISRRLRDELMIAVGLSRLARYSLFRGRSSQAAQLIDKALPVLRDEALPGHSGIILHTAGALALEQDRLAEAEEYFAELLQTVHHPHATIHALEGLAVVAVRLQRFERGLQLLSAARTMESRRFLRHPWWHERVRSALHTAMEALPARRSQQALTLGGAMSPQTLLRYALEEENSQPARADGDGLLSQREREVVGLVVDGLTNRQIASRLYLSVRTVETHIHNVRAALGLRSRTHLAAWAAQQGLHVGGAESPV